MAEGSERWRREREREREKERLRYQAMGKKCKGRKWREK